MTMERSVPMRGTVLKVWATSVLFLTALGCSSAGDTVSVQYTEEDWDFKGHPGKILHSDNFNVFTTVDDAVFLEAIPNFMEASYRQYVDLMPHGDGSDHAMDTYLFASRRQWNRFTKEFAHPHRVSIYLRIRSGGFTERSTAVLHHIAEIH